MERVNKHSNQYKKEQISAREKKLLNKYQPKKFSTEFRFLFYLIFGATILFQAASLLTALTLPASWLHAICYNWPISFALVFLFMLLLEIVKRFVAGKAIKNGWQYGKWFTFGICSAVILSLASIVSSTLGTPILIKEFGASPYLTDTAGMATTYKEEQNKILSFWMPQIAEAKEGAKRTHKENNWKGVTTRSARPTVLKYKEQEQAFKDSLNTALAIIGGKYSKQLDRIEKENKGIMDKDKKDKAATGYILGFITFLLELLFLLSTFWIEYFDYREALEIGESNSKSSDSRGKSKMKVVESAIFTGKSDSNSKSDSKRVTVTGFKHKEGDVIERDGKMFVLYAKDRGGFAEYQARNLRSQIGYYKKSGNTAQVKRLEGLLKKL